MTHLKDISNCTEVSIYSLDTFKKERILNSYTEAQRLNFKKQLLQ